MPDPFNVLDWDRYLYVRANPLRFTDPTGHTCLVYDSSGSCSVYENSDITSDLGNHLKKLGLGLKIPAAFTSMDSIGNNPEELMARTMMGEEPGKILDETLDDDVTGVGWAIRNRYRKLYTNSDDYRNCVGREWVCAANSEIYGSREGRALDPMNHWKGHWDSQFKMILAYNRALTIAKYVLKANSDSDITRGAVRWSDAGCPAEGCDIVTRVNGTGSVYQECTNCVAYVRTHFKDDFYSNPPPWCVTTVNLKDCR